MAVGLHEFFRNSDIYFMANYAQTVNVIGAIKTTKTAAELETTGLVLKLYREKFGVIPVQINGDIPAAGYRRGIDARPQCSDRGDCQSHGANASPLT